jgi:hypothetical protein
MLFNEFFCERLMAQNKMYAAHIVVKTIRKNLIPGKSKMDDWINTLDDQDKYLIIRIIEEHSDDGTIFHDINECARIIFFIENEKDPNEEEIKSTISKIYFLLKNKDLTLYNNKNA